MKKWFLILIVSAFVTNAHASHISGGEMYYTYLGKSPTDANKLRYAITLLLYKDTTVTGPTWHLYLATIIFLFTEATTMHLLATMYSPEKIMNS